jgi:hypothetical protein
MRLFAAEERLVRGMRSGSTAALMMTSCHQLTRTACHWRFCLLQQISHVNFIYTLLTVPDGSTTFCQRLQMALKMAATYRSVCAWATSGNN